jgi:hypothetical protein
VPTLEALGICGTAISRRGDSRMKELQAKSPRRNKGVPGNHTRKKKENKKEKITRQLHKKWKNCQAPVNHTDLKGDTSTWTWWHARLASANVYTTIPSRR